MVKDIPILVMVNKQDLPDAMSILDIERHLGVKAYSMIATDPENRNKMIQIIADILEMSGAVSPLLKPLIDRDRKVKEVEQAVEKGDFFAAVTLFEELSDLCLELGDDRVSQDFHAKAQKIKQLLAESGQVPAPGINAAPPPPPTEKTDEEKTLNLLNRIHNETRTTRKWLVFMGVILLITIIVAVIGLLVRAAELAAGY